MKPITPDDDVMLPVLRALSANTAAIEPPADAPKVLFVSVYCFQSFAIRGFHELACKANINTHSLFFKNAFTNHHKPVTDEEIALLVEEVRTFNPDVIAYSVLAPYAIIAERMTEAIRDVSDCPIIAGGKHATISPDEALAYADYACKGEGELVLLDIFERLKAGSSDFIGIKGLWHKNENGDVVDNGQRHLIQDLDLIPFESVGEPNMAFIEHNRIARNDPECESTEILIMAGRGCVYLCSYCVNALLIPMNRGNGRFVRMRSPASLIRQIEQRRAKQPNARMISFNDEVFGVFTDWTEEFCLAYGEYPGRLPFNCELVPKLIKEENVTKLAEVGLIEMHFGIQSGSDDVRNSVLKRPGKNDDLVEKAELLARLGIAPQCDLILDNPFDDAEVMIETLALLKRMPHPLRLNVYKLQYFPHYPLTNAALEAGFITPDDITPQKVAERVMFNWIHKPRWSLNRKRVLENCVYLVPWNNAAIWWLADRLSRRHDVFLATLVNVLVVWRYQLDFRQNPVLILLRRIAIVTRMIGSGDLASLKARLKEKLHEPKAATG